MNRRFTVPELNNKEISIRFFYGESNEKHPERSYTTPVELLRNGKKETFHCRFVECRIEEVTESGFTPIAVAKTVCSPQDRFTRRAGRSLAIQRAVEKLGVSPEVARKIRMYGIGDRESVKRYNRLNGITEPVESKTDEAQPV